VVAERLRVSHVLEGSVRRQGERIRVAAKLVETSSDTQLWSEIYDRQIEDIFAIQGDIARQIVSALQLRLLPPDAVHATTRDASAYELYLRGLSFLHRFGPKSVRFAIDMFRRATELDPNFAKAWAGLAKAHATLAIYYSGDVADLQASDEASCRSMELAPGLAEAHTARGVSLLAQERYDEAAAQFERAVTQNPRSFDAWYQYARTALHQGALEKALELFEKASKVDPDDYQSPLIAAPVYRKLGYEAEALEAERRGVTCRAIRTMHARTFSRLQRSTILVNEIKRLTGRTGPLRSIQTMPPRAITSHAFMRRWKMPTRHSLFCRAP
jgi:adenylate cyclase